MTKKKKKREVAVPVVPVAAVAVVAAVVVPNRTLRSSQKSRTKRLLSTIIRSLLQVKVTERPLKTKRRGNVAREDEDVAAVVVRRKKQKTT